MEMKREGTLLMNQSSVSVIEMVLNEGEFDAVAK